MKSFKVLIEELVNENYDSYPADEMTMSELRIAINAAKNILDMFESGARVQRWQISAIVKASDELASVCTNIRADLDAEMEDEEEWLNGYDDDEDEAEGEYVGYEYPSMYGEEVEQINENPFNQRLQKAPGGDELPAPAKGVVKKHGIKFKEGDTVVPHTGPHAGVPHKVTSARVGSVHIHPMVSINKHKYDNTTIRAKHEHLSPYKDSVKEETDYKVSVEGLPDMYVKANNPGEVKTNLRKIVKNPEMIKSVDRVTQSLLQKIFRDKAAGKEETDKDK